MNDEMKARIKGEWDALRDLTKETMQALASRNPDIDGRGPSSGATENGSFQPTYNGSFGPEHNDSLRPEHNGSSWAGADPSRRRYLERLGKLDEALVDGRISLEQYEEMRARAEQEFAGEEA